MNQRVVDRPLRLGEVLAETIRLYGERVWAALALGAVFTGALVLGLATHEAVYFVLVTVAFGVTLAAAVRVVRGDSFAEAWSQVLVRGPMLLVLCVAVGLPFVVSLRFGIAVLVGAAWLALTCFAIPVAMVESEGEPASWPARLGYALDRTVQLARAEYLHALGVIAALLVIEWLLSVVVEGLLRGFADNDAVIAAILAGIVLWPLVFLGLSVLYFEQRTRGRDRAVSAAG